MLQKTTLMTSPFLAGLFMFSGKLSLHHHNAMVRLCWVFFFFPLKQIYSSFLLWMLLQACLVLGTLQGGLVSDRWEIAIVMDRDLETQSF